MAKTQTEYFKLKLPQKSDHFNIQDFNNNSEKIDVELLKRPTVTFDIAEPKNPNQYDVWYVTNGRIVDEIRVYDLETDENGKIHGVWITYKMNKQTVDGQLVTNSDFENYKNSEETDGVTNKIIEVVAKMGVTPVFG